MFAIFENASWIVNLKLWFVSNEWLKVYKSLPSPPKCSNRIYFLLFQNGEKMGYDTEAFAIYDVMGLLIFIPFSIFSLTFFLKQDLNLGCFHEYSRLHLETVFVSTFSWLVILGGRPVIHPRINSYLILSYLWLQVCQTTNLYSLRWECLGWSCFASDCRCKRKSFCIALIDYYDKAGSSWSFLLDIKWRLFPPS